MVDTDVSRGVFATFWLLFSVYHARSWIEWNPSLCGHSWFRYRCCDPFPYHVIQQSAYGIGLLILSLAALPRILPTFMGKLDNAPIGAIFVYVLGTLMNFFLLFVYWHWYWHVESCISFLSHRVYCIRYSRLQFRVEGQNKSSIGIAWQEIVSLGNKTWATK